MIWAELSLSISVCDVTSKMSADEELPILRITISLVAFSYKLETVSIAEPLQNRQHAPLTLSTLGSKEKREGE